MNICHVITRLIIGGAQENTVLTCRGLVDRGHRVTLVAGPETGPEGSLWAAAEATGCDLIALDALRRSIHPIRDARAGRALRRLFGRIQPDVVHTHSSKAGVIARYAAAAAGVPVIVHTIHGMSFNRTQSLATRTLYRWLERRAARSTTAFISVADAMTEQAVRAGIAPRERFRTIHSGMEVDAFVPDAAERERRRGEWGIDDGEVVVGTIARLFANKGYEAIIEAMPRALARNPRLRFVWIGDGAQRAAYERRLAAAGLRNRVHLTGLIPPEAIPSHINGLDIVLHASRWEGLPRALVQGLLMGVPGISFDNDGAPEVIVPGETGLLVPYGDTDGLADAIAAFADDAPGRRVCGERGRAMCLDRFDWRVMVERIERLYGDAQERAARNRRR
jgi:glycosyltransferase involved in cell wall biosynthesis